MVGIVRQEGDGGHGGVGLDGKKGGYERGQWVWWNTG